MKILDLVNVRQLKSSDVNFILSSSIKCLQSYSKHLYPAHSPRNLYEYLERIMLAILTHSNASVLIACHKDDNDHILAYLVTHPDSNHIYMQYTKYTFRGLGLQKHVLMPLLLDDSQKHTVEWATKEMCKLAKENRIVVRHQFIEEILLRSKNV